MRCVGRVKSLDMYGMGIVRMGFQPFGQESEGMCYKNFTFEFVVGHEDH